MYAEIYSFAKREKEFLEFPSFDFRNEKITYAFK